MRGQPERDIGWEVNHGDGMVTVTDNRSGCRVVKVPYWQLLTILEMVPTGAGTNTALQALRDAAK